MVSVAAAASDSTAVSTNAAAVPYYVTQAAVAVFLLQLLV
jgi:hypothetical protein